MPPTHLATIAIATTTRHPPERADARRATPRCGPRPNRPVNTEQFIHTYIESVDHLRAVLLMHSDPSAAWDATELGAKLYILPATATAALDRLAAKGLCRVEGPPRRYRYQPQSAELETLVREIVELDRQRPVTLLNMVYNRRTDIKAFADAFRLRKEGEG